jgi:hypothetical protein
VSDVGKLPPVLPDSDRVPAPIAPLAYTRIEPPPPRPFYRLHPISGVLTIAIDTFFFGAEVVTLGLDWPIISVLAFTITFAGVYWAQRRLDRDTRLASALKAFVAGFLAGIPTSITGTIFGTMILFASGLSACKSKFSPK